MRSVVFAFVTACALIAVNANAQDSAAQPHSGDLWERDVLTGDWGGLRNRLEDAGVLLGADTIDEILGNATGGVHRGSVYDGRLELLASIDLDKILSWPGAVFHVNAYQTHGRGLSANALGNNVLVASNIEASRSFRLFDAWVEQVAANGAISLRIGQIAADDEFFVSQYAANFINATFGWPAILSTDLPSGGPAYPLATPGARIKYIATKEVSLQAALLTGDPAGAGSGDPQSRDASGTAFRFGPNALAIAEGTVALNQGSDATALPVTYKFGGWFHSGDFADQHVDTRGVSLAASDSTGIPATRHDDYGFYAIVDQSIWRKPGTSDQGGGVFLRIAGAPVDRNLVSLYGDIGLAVKGPVASRGDDVAGIAVAYAKISNRARELNEDVQSFTGTAVPVRDGETALELTYHVQISQWWSVQPDLQFIFHPGGNVAPPGSALGTGAVPDAVVVGFRSLIIF